MNIIYVISLHKDFIKLFKSDESELIGFVIMKLLMKTALVLKFVEASCHDTPFL